jgi:hypothetical protein
VKTVHVLYAAGIILLAAAALEQLYEHPSYGRGLKALVAVVQAGALFA